jgi:hypothetical protein
MKIEITEEQWKHIQELMKIHNITQDEAVTFLMTVGMREMKLREDYE